MSTPAKLGAAMARIRQQQGVTQREAARRLGISAVHLCNVERGKSSPSMALVRRFAESFGVDPYLESYAKKGRRK